MIKTLWDEIFPMRYMAFVSNGTSVYIYKKLKSAVFKNSPCFSYFNLYCTNAYIHFSSLWYAAANALDYLRERKTISKKYLKLLAKNFLKLLKLLKFLKTT